MKLLPKMAGVVLGAAAPLLATVLEGEKTRTHNLRLEPIPASGADREGVDEGGDGDDE